MAYYATYDSITTADKSNDPAWVEITEEQYLYFLDGMVNLGLQVYIRQDGTPALRPVAPWDYDGTNYVFNETTNEWEPVVPPQEPEEGE